MLIENNTLKRIDPEDIIGGVFVAPDEVFYIDRLICRNLVGKNIIKMFLPNVIEIGNDFLYFNTTLKYLEIPKVEKIGNSFLFNNEFISDVYIPNIRKIGNSFLFKNKVISEMYMPNIKEIGLDFLALNDSLEYLDIPNIKEIGICFLFINTKFNYTPGIIKALKDDLYIGGEVVNKVEYLRKLNISKILC